MKITPLDRIYSEFIRKRAIRKTGGCEKCLSVKFDMTKEDGTIFPDWKQLQCSHYHGRASKSVRYDPANGSGICGGCHFYLGGHPLEHTEWMQGRLGETEFDLLTARSRPQRYQDKQAIMLYLKDEIRKLEEVTNE